MTTVATDTITASHDHYLREARRLGADRVLLEHEVSPTRWIARASNAKNEQIACVSSSTVTHALRVLVLALAAPRGRG